MVRSSHCNVLFETLASAPRWKLLVLAEVCSGFGLLTAALFKDCNQAYLAVSLTCFALAVATATAGYCLDKNRSRTKSPLVDKIEFIHTPVRYSCITGSLVAANVLFTQPLPTGVWTAAQLANINGQLRAGCAAPNAKSQILFVPSLAGGYSR